MFSFLVEITKTGRINEALWSDPETMISGGHGSLFDLFSPEAKDTLAHLIKQCIKSENEIIMDTSLRLTFDKSNILLCMMPLDKHVLVLAAEEGKSGVDARNKGSLYMIQMFMAAFASHSKNSASNIRTDMIQTLAKELINRKRQLQDTNAKMNLINEDLNNRLVKDALTGLVSRYQYRTEIEYCIGRDPGKLGVFIFIDVDNFKSVNDTYGHAVGDKYLVEFAERLKRLNINDMIRMRISGDEFGLFAYGMDVVTADMLAEIWRKIQATVLAAPINAGGYSLPIAISAGMSVYGIDTLDIYELIDFADFAMYKVKRSGKNSYRLFNRAEYDRSQGAG